MSCLSDGAPVGRMVLRRLSEDQDVELQSSNGSSTSFTLSSALLADSALYQCEAFNEHGSQRASTHITVKGGCQASGTHTPHSSFISLPCIRTGNRRKLSLTPVRFFGSLIKLLFSTPTDLFVFTSCLVLFALMGWSVAFSLSCHSCRYLRT